jgi:formate dehydrogenase gamma subunit
MSPPKKNSGARKSGSAKISSRTEKEIARELGRDNRYPDQDNGRVGIERVFKRFTLGQRWEHGILILSFTVLLLTGLPQKYFQTWGDEILTTPERLNTFRQIHYYAAIVLILEVVYHLARAIVLIFRGKLSAAIFPTWQDVRDAGQMVKYLLFLSRNKPEFGKYNFEQKFTYWFLFFGIGIMVISGLILLFPLAWTRIFPGGIIPAAQLAHSEEAIIATIFVLIWHFYHVHFERLNLSIFTGWLNEREMRQYHGLEFERLTGEPAGQPGPENEPGATQEVV